MNKETTTREYADVQKESQKRLCLEYLKPLVEKYQSKKILDVGCGLGGMVNELRKDNYQAYGVDLPCLEKFWIENGNNLEYFISADAANLPLEDNSFDLVYTFGAIEHVGTEDGHYKLLDNYWEIRQKFVNELIRVTKPGGKILVSCPNKNFPVDLQHTQKIHKTFGKNFLLSYNDIRKLFKHKKIKPLPLDNFFGYIQFKDSKTRIIPAIINLYCKIVSNTIPGSVLNPYMLVEITK